MFILRRFLAFIPVALIVALIVFLMLHLSPGDPVAAIAGDSATAADIARIRAELGLDDPLPEQFVRWCMELIQGDLGRSYFLNRPVADLIADRVGPTLSLAGFTIVLTVLIAVPLGAWAAYRQGGWVDRALMGFSVLGFSIPSFVLGYCFVWLFGLKLNSSARGASASRNSSKRLICVIRCSILAVSSAGVIRKRIEFKSHFSGTMAFSRRKLARIVAGTPKSA